MLLIGHFMLSATLYMGGAPATSRHTSHSLRLLPSGPDRVHELLLREDQSPIDSVVRPPPNVGTIIKHRLTDCNPNLVIIPTWWFDRLTLAQNGMI